MGITAPASASFAFWRRGSYFFRWLGASAASALRLLRPGGAFVAVTHDYRGWINRLLGRRSPNVDIEHMQLFSARASRELLSSRGFIGVAAAAFANAYRPSYWLRLAPVPSAIKHAAIGAIRGTWLDAGRVRFNVGNTMSWGFAPRD